MQIMMHMADGLISVPVGLLFYVVMVLFVAFAIRKTQESSHRVALMAVMGAFVFAAQMINFTIPGTGSSGHICGGIMLCLALGEFPALLAIASVLVIQCLFFGDGGLLALGCNVFNMGIIPCCIVYPLVIKPLLKKMGLNPKSITIVSLIGCLLGLELGALCVCLQTTISGISALPLSTFMALMLSIHLAIGLVEGIVTAAIINYVYAQEPELITAQANDPKGYSRLVKVLAVAAILVAGGLSIFASGYPDGLEWSIQGVTGDTEIDDEDQVKKRFSEVQEKTSLLPDYHFGDDESVFSGASAGVIGVGMMLIAVGGLGYLVTRKRRHE